LNLAQDESTCNHDLRKSQKTGKWGGDTRQKSERSGKSPSRDTFLRSDKG